jgi:branched-chain amino acid transport system ATP-binding protein
VKDDAGFALCVRGLSRKFGALAALDGIDLEIEAGAIHGIIGPNGSGKTTLFNCVTGLLKPDAGSIAVFGRDITGSAAKNIAGMGVRRTFQGGSLVASMTVVENVMSGADLPVGRSLGEAFFRAPFARPRAEQIMREAALRALERVGLEDSADRWASDLAWAERQLVQIARALIAFPRLLLLDEPAAGMGPKETEKVAEIVRDARKNGASIAVVSHDVSFVTVLSDTVTVLSNGRKIAQGRPDFVRGDPRVREAYLGVR